MKSKSLLLHLILLQSLSLMAQGQLRGKVVSAIDGKPVYGAHLQLDNQTLKTISDTDGRFNLGKLKPGSYQLRVSHIAFQTLETEVNIPLKLDLVINLVDAVYLSDEVVVKATRATSVSPVSYSEIDSHAIGQQNLGVDLPFLLQSVPSLVVSSDAGTGIGYTGLRIRGSDLTRINVTLNGVPVNDAESHGVFFVDLPDLASSVDNIQLQRGVGTSANGAAAFGASMNIKTSISSENAYATLSSTGGSFNTLKNTLGFSTGRNNQGFSLNGRLSKISTDGYIDRGWADLRSFYLAGAWVNKNTLIGLVTTGGIQSTYQAWYGIPKDSLQTNRKYNPSGEILDAKGDVIGYYPDQTDNYQQDYYQLHVAHQFNNYLNASGAAFLTLGKGYYESWKNNSSFESYGLPPFALADTLIERSDLIQQKWLDNAFYGFNLAVNYEKGNVSATAGGGWNQYKGDHFGDIIWSRFFPADNNVFRWYENNGLKTDFHVFAKLNHAVSNKISLFGDIQYRHIHYVMDGIHDDLGDLSQQHTFNFFNPKAGIYYAFRTNSKLFASVAVSNREPNRSVYRDADDNQIIKPEMLIDYELGYGINSTKVNYSINAYYMAYTDQLVLTGKINNVGAPIMTNVPESYRLGIEQTIDWKVSSLVSLSGHFSLSRNKIIDFTEFVDNWNYWDDPANEPYQYSFARGKTDISFSPELVSGIALEIKPVSNLNFAFSANYVSRQFLDNTSNRQRSLDPYMVSNIMMSYQVKQPLFNQLEFKLAVNNLFNTLYASNGWVYKYIYDQQEGVLDGYFPQAGIHAMLGLTVGF